MKIKYVILAIIVLFGFISPDAFAQQAQSFGVMKYFDNLESTALRGLQAVMVIGAVAGAVVGYFFVMTVKDNLSSSPSSGQPDWGKAVGQFIFAGLTLSGATFLAIVTETFNKDEGSAGAGSKARDRYKGTN